MSFRAFLRDRLTAYFIYALALGTVMLFMKAMKLSGVVMTVFAGIVSAAVIIAELWEYFRKRGFYTEMSRCIEEMDKKYLLAEVIEEPDFCEGKMIYDVLRRTNSAMNEQISGFRRENSDFREYIEMWVHEIKLPLASLDLMCHNDGNGRYSEQLRLIEDDIENVLFYTRSGSAEKDYIFKKVLLKRVFADIAVRKRADLQMRNISLRTDSLDTTVCTDAKWLMYILGQLFGNSMKYISHDRPAEIFVYAVEDSESTQLHFRDNGIGIPETDLPYIFEKSFTGENGRIRSGATGMGLYIIKTMCSKLGHTIRAESVRGEYTDIIITFGKNDMLSVMKEGEF